MNLEVRVIGIDFEFTQDIYLNVKREYFKDKILRKRASNVIL